MLFKTLNIDNLEAIQEAVLARVPPSSYEKNDLFYVKNNIKYFLDIPELKKLLDDLDFTNHIHSDGIALNVTMPGVTLPIHYDSDKFKYSFNIPLKNCEGTFVNLYHTDSEPQSVPRKHPIHNTYVVSRRFDPALCRLLESHEAINPCILNTNVPHNVVNKTNKIRVMLLIRLDNKINKRFENDNI